MDARQLEFIDFVLNQYVASGVDELSSDKLPTLLELKYKSVKEGVNALGGAETARTVFVDFQRYLDRANPLRMGAV